MTPTPFPTPVYLDYHSTTPVDPRVIEAMACAMRDLVGNPNAVEHAAGRQAAQAIDHARAEVGRLVGACPDAVRFTSGASDAIRKALALVTSRSPVTRIAAMPVEHPAMLAGLSACERAGRSVVLPLAVDGQGQLVRDSLLRTLEAGADLVVMMVANNEIGTVYPVKEVLAECARRGVSVLIDATQAAGRIELDYLGSGADFIVLSGHKIYGPKGVGALIARARDHELETVFAHAGTPNVPAIVGFGLAARLAGEELEADRAHASSLRDRLQTGLQRAVTELVVNGDPHHRLPNSLHVSIPGVPNDAILARIGNVVAMSTGAACASGAQEPSHVLRAIGMDERLIDGALRLSVGRFTTVAQVDFAVDTMAQAVSAIAGARREQIAC